MLFSLVQKFCIYFSGAEGWKS